MSLEQLGLIADIVSAIAIVITLVYLAVQIKDSARSSRSAADSTACRAAIPRDAGPVFHGMPGHRSTLSRAG